MSEHENTQEGTARHILSLSGGKDSSALAVFMKDKVSEMEYVFCDTGCELPETYEYLEKMEAFLGKKVVRLNSDLPFDRWLEIYSGYLPSPRSRWCTKNMKIIPFEKFVGEDRVYSYIGIRADEDREGYISLKGNITPVYPFKEAGIVEKDVYRLLEESGLGVPSYYQWRSRSGCYFCFFQRRNEWVGLLEKHPDLFYKSKTYEKVDETSGHKFTWIKDYSLGDIERNREQIKANSARQGRENYSSGTLLELFSEFSDQKSSTDEEDSEEACLICHL